MNKVHLILGLAVIGVGGYFLFRRDAYGQSPAANPSLFTQPSQSFPFKPMFQPRADNKSEPWYGGSRTFQQNPTANTSNIFGVNMDLLGAAKDVGAVASIADSLGSLWDDLDVGNWFGGGSDEFNLDFWSADAEDSISVSDNFGWDSFDNSFGGSGGEDYFSSIA